MSDESSKLTKAPTEQDFEQAHNEIAKAYLTAALQILFLKGHGELNFLKKTVETPDGGTYLLQLQHVSGKKINVQELFSQSEDARP